MKTIEEKANKTISEAAFPTRPKQVVIGTASYNYLDIQGFGQVGHKNIYGEVAQDGMSKRFYAACAAMQGVLSNPQFRIDVGGSPKEIVEYAYDLADELLKQESL